MNPCLVRRVKALIPVQYVTRGMRNWPQPPNYKDVIMPPYDNRLLPALDSTPFIPVGTAGFKYPRRVSDIRGPELIHNTFMYNQYGIMALAGGNLKNEHINLMRDSINRNIHQDNMFAVWRIDPPWKSVTKRRQGTRHGGGKPGISYYVTPVRAGRVILEVGGRVEFEEVLPFLHGIVTRLPFATIAIDSNGLAELREQHRRKQALNMNPVSYARCIEKNMAHARSFHMSNEYDQIWFGKFE